MRRRKIFLFRFVPLFAAFCYGHVAVAETFGSGERQRVKKWVSWQFQDENDFLAFSDNSDEFYTQGLLLTLQRHPEHTPAWAQRTGLWLWNRLHPDRAATPMIAFEIGQHIFTPEDLVPAELIVEDRPYAGYLYGGLVLTATERTAENPIQQLFEIQIGIIGPQSGAEWAQTRIHELNDSQRPNGWDNQLPFEPGLNLIYLWRRKLGSSTADVVPHLGGAFGNLQIYANAGATLRLGRNLSGFPILINRTTVLPRVEPSRPKWDGYLFVGAEGRLIGRNIFLDGSTFKDSHSVDRERFVYDLKAGFSVRYRSVRLSYTFVRRSREFAPLPPGRSRGEHDFGSLSLAWERAF